MVTGHPLWKDFFVTVQGLAVAFLGVLPFLGRPWSGAFDLIVLQCSKFLDCSFFISYLICTKYVHVLYILSM